MNLEMPLDRTLENRRQASRKTVQFHALLLGVLLVLYCKLNPSGNPTSKSQVELNQANVGVLNISFSAYPPVWEIVIKIRPDIMMVMWGCPVLLVVNLLISIQLMNGVHDGYLKHVDVLNTSNCTIKEVQSHNSPS
jgi:hypothetical protein